MVCTASLLCLNEVSGVLSLSLQRASGFCIYSQTWMHETRYATKITGVFHYSSGTGQLTQARGMEQGGEQASVISRSKGYPGDRLLVGVGKLIDLILIYLKHNIHTNAWCFTQEKRSSRRRKQRTFSYRVWLHMYLGYREQSVIFQIGRARHKSEEPREGLPRWRLGRWERKPPQG